MECRNHTGVGAVATCSGCAEGFCENCLVSLKGERYCADCKTMAIEAYPIVAECPEAGEALKYALIGIVCFGIILEPIAIAKAVKARQLTGADPTLGGRGKATAALVISSTVLILWILGMYARVAGIQSP